MSDPYPPPCIHTAGTGLCPACQACYDEDPSAYLEYGDHPAGLERWREEEERIAADIEESDRRRAEAAKHPHQREDDIPF